jgi:hypothetical protein
LIVTTDAWLVNLGRPLSLHAERSAVTALNFDFQSAGDTVGDGEAATCDPVNSTASCKD